MELEIIFRGTEPSLAMEKYVIKYAEKFKKYFGKENTDSVFVHVVLEGHLTHHIMNVEVRIKSQHFDFTIQREGKEMYVLIDETMKIAEEQLQQKKEKFIDSIKQRKKCC
jgi:ribosomal subunit interface protein